MPALAALYAACPTLPRDAAPRAGDDGYPHAAEPTPGSSPMGSAITRPQGRHRPGGGHGVGLLAPARTSDTQDGASARVDAATHADVDEEDQAEPLRHL